jgi:hypothetical protein
MYGRFDETLKASIFLGELKMDFKNSAKPVQNRQYNIDDEENLIDDYDFRKLNTVRDIGYHLTERMKKAMVAIHADDDPSFNNPPNIAYPDGETPYADMIKAVGDMFEGENSSVKYRYGDPTLVSNVNYDAPSLAMGESTILNPDFQFNELDDVRSDFRRPYIGRLYSERIYDYNLPTVVFEPGILKLNTGLFGIIATLASNGLGSSGDMAKYLRDPQTNPIKFAFQKIGAAIRGIINFTVGGLVSGTRFYKFEPNMRVYMKFVNEMLIEVASWMGLAMLPQSDLEDYSDRGGDTQESAEALEVKMNSSLYKESEIDVDTLGDFSIPRSKGYKGLGKSLSVLNILGGWKAHNSSTKPGGGTKKSVGEDVTDAVTETIAMTAAMFVTYGLSKGINVSETFSNNTIRHPLEEDLKAKGDEAFQQTAMGAFATAKTTTEILGNLLNEKYLEAAGGFVKTLATSLAKGGTFGEGGLILSGEGRFQLPEIWKDSDYSRTKSLEFEFRAPYGNRLCIFENTMVQAIFLICMTAPRQVGSSTYMSPFYIRAFSKGLFSVEVGLIERLTIKRGEEKNERTNEGFSRVMECSVEIKDVIPNLMIGLNAGIFGVLSSKNIGFREYVAMFANVDMIDRTVILNHYKNFVNILVNRFSADNLFNEFKYSISQTLPFKLMLKARQNFWNYKPPTAVSRIKPASLN